MKMQIVFAAVLLVLAGYSTNRVLADYVVASNVLDSQTHSNASAEVGEIAPPFSNHDKIGQSFTPLSSGILTSIVAMVTHGDQPVSATPPLDVSVYSSASGIPITQLATLSFPAADFAPFNSNNRRKTFDFSQFHIPLDSSHEYMITFETPYGVNVQSGLDAPFLVDWSPSSVDGDHSLTLGRNLSSASDVTAWHVETAYEELGIVVRAIPEPTTATLLLLGMLGCGCRRRNS